MLGFLWIRQVWYALHAHARLRDTAFQQESVRSGSVGTIAVEREFVMKKHGVLVAINCPIFL